MNMDIKLVLLILSCCGGIYCGWRPNTVNPGLKIQITQKGLQYAAQNAITVLAANLRGQSIPDQSGDAHVPVAGHISYQVTGMRINSFSSPRTTVTTSPFEWHVSNIGASIHGDWRYHNHGWIHVSDHGSFDVSLSGWSLDTVLVMGVDPSGRPTLKTNRCSCGVGGLKVKFHGGASWLYNFFDKSIANTLKGQLQKQLCNAVDKAINVKAAKELATMKVTVPLDKKIDLDYRLITSPVFSTTDIQSFHKGEIFWTGDKQESPFSAPPLPKIQTKKMITIWLSEYVMNTLGYVEYKHKALAYGLSKKDLPKDKQDYLNTTCKGACIGSVIPQIAKKYPGASMILAMEVTEPPKLNITAKTGLSGTFTGTVDFNVVYPNKPLVFVFSTKMSVTFDLTAAIKGLNATVDIKKFSVSNMVVVKSEIGEIQIAGLNIVMQMAINNFVKPKLQELGNRGFELPTIKGIQFVSPQIAMVQNAIVVLTDVNYKG